jgi:hypothetical protein
VYEVRLVSPAALKNHQKLLQNLETGSFFVFNNPSQLDSFTPAHPYSNCGGCANEVRVRVLI